MKANAEFNHKKDLWKRAHSALRQFKSICLEIQGNHGRIRRGRKKQMEANSNPPRRFYLERQGDITGLSGTGRCLEGVLWQNGKVTVQWRPPLATIAIYDDFETFEKLHVHGHPSSNVVGWLEHSEGWHCFDCGAHGWMQNFCGQCGSPSTGYHPTTAGWKSTERYEVEREIEQLNKRRAELVGRLTAMKPE
jgi:hypothetical protein